MSNSLSFVLKQSGAIARITLNRSKKRNALNWHFWTEFPKTIRALSDSGQTRVLLIDATGPVFCAGIDLAMFSDMGSSVKTAHDREAFRHILAQMQSGFDALEAARFVVIAAIQGPCLGGGVDLISACDLRYGTTNAEFRIEEINVGMMADLGTLQRLPKLISPALVAELAYTGASMDAKQAVVCGLLNAQFAEARQLASHVNAIAETIAEKPPLAIAATKDAILHARDHSVAETMRYMRALQAGIFQPQDIEAAITARINKQTPAFDDLTKLSSNEIEN